MTEAEWVVCQDPENMLESLRGRASDRKLTLFGVACLRQVWHLLAEDAGRRLAETAEAFADGRATLQQLREAEGLLDQRLCETHGDWWEDRWSSPDLRLLVQCFNLLWDEGCSRDGSVRELALECREAGDTPGAQVALLRCIFGNPFRPLSLAPAVLAWQQGTVAKMATVIYEEHKWGDMPLLGDALEEAGVTDQAALDHCRGPGPHARGCHVVDLLGRS